MSYLAMEQHEQLKLTKVERKMALCDPRDVNPVAYRKDIQSVTRGRGGRCIQSACFLNGDCGSFEL